jgi:hypothetical protein
MNSQIRYLRGSFQALKRLIFGFFLRSEVSIWKWIKKHIHINWEIFL